MCLLKEGPLIYNATFLGPSIYYVSKELRIDTGTSYLLLELDVLLRANATLQDCLTKQFAPKFIQRFMQQKHLKMTLGIKKKPHLINVTIS